MVAALLFCLGVCGGFCHAAEKVIKMELSSFLPAQEKLSLMLQEWCDEVEKRTSGRVSVNLHPGATLTPPSQTYDSVVNEIIDIGFGPTGVTQGRFPLMEVMDLPLGLHSAYMATKLSNDVHKKFRPKELANVKVLFMLSSPPAVIQTRKPVRTLEDLEGVKIRCVGGTTVKVMSSLGAIPVVISTGDTYDALSKGVADGAIVINDALEVLKWGDVLKYTTTNIRTSLVNNGYFVMNKNKWKSLPPDVQKIIDKLSEEYQDKMSKLWDEKEKDAIKSLAAKKHTMFTLTNAEEEKWYRKVVPVYDLYVKEKSAKRLPAADVLKFCQDWVRKNQK
jgi:TRAP-type C4-dicarboxylate transport system substrate-binding protein